MRHAATPELARRPVDQADVQPLLVIAPTGTTKSIGHPLMRNSMLSARQEPSCRNQSLRAAQPTWGGSLRIRLSCTPRRAAALRD